MASRKLYHALAILVDARRSCIEKGAADPHYSEWSIEHQAAISDLVFKYMPRGAGLDSGTSIDMKKSTPEKLVFTTAFHHHTESGYAGWTEHPITVRASLIHGLWFTVSGRNRNDVKDHLMDVFDDALNTVVHNVA